MSKTETATCQACDWTGPVEDTKELRDVRDRVLPGDVMPAGICPEEGCGASAMLNHADPAKDRLRSLAKSARKALAAGPLLQPVCNACGGTRVQVDAWAAWDPDTQRWELHSTYETASFCADCDGECSYTMKPLSA